MQHVALDAVGVAQQPAAAAAGQFACEDRPLPDALARRGMHMPPVVGSAAAPAQGDRPQPLGRGRHVQAAVFPSRDEALRAASDLEPRLCGERSGRKSGQQQCKRSDSHSDRDFSKSKLGEIGVVCKFFIAVVQDFVPSGIYIIPKAGTRDGKRWREGRPEAVGQIKKIEVIREGIRFRTSTVLKS